ncbi:hypothetical protein YC2023_108044 [Brassica napus]
MITHLTCPKRAEKCTGKKRGYTDESLAKLEMQQSNLGSCLAANSDIGALRGSYLSNQKELSNKLNCNGNYTHQGLTSNWNHVQSFSNERVMGSTRRVILCLLCLNFSECRTSQSYLWRPDYMEALKNAKRKNKREEDKRFKLPDLSQERHHDVTCFILIKEAPPDAAYKPKPIKYNFGIILLLYDGDRILPMLRRNTRSPGPMVRNPRDSVAPIYGVTSSDIKVVDIKAMLYHWFPLLEARSWQEAKSNLVTVALGRGVKVCDSDRIIPNPSRSASGPWCWVGRSVMFLFDCWLAGRFGGVTEVVSEHGFVHASGTHDLIGMKTLKWREFEAKPKPEAKEERQIQRTGLWYGLDRWEETRLRLERTSSVSGK